MSKLWLPNQQNNASCESLENKKIVSYVGIKEVYPEMDPSIPTLRELLSTLSLTDAIFWCARLNLIVSNPNNTDHFGKQAYCIRTLLPESEFQRIVYRRISNEEKLLTVFFRSQLLELIRWICLWCNDHNGDGNTFSDAVVCRNFFKAALVTSDLWGERTYGNKLYIDDDDTTGIEAARTRALGCMRVAYDASTVGIDPMVAIGRGRKIFLEYFQKLHPDFVDEFRQATGMHPDDFYSLQSLIATHYLDQTPERVVKSDGNSGIFSLQSFFDRSTNLGVSSRHFFECFSQTASELKASLGGKGDSSQVDTALWKDIGCIRERPIFRADDGRAIVLDPVYFSESATVGPLFTLLKKGVKKSASVLDKYGYAFEYYVASILRSMYPKSAEGLAERLLVNVAGTDGEQNVIQIADAALMDVDATVLFESKASWLRDADIEHSDANQFVKDIYRKYVGKDDGTPKGAGQLARAIKKLATYEWRASEPAFVYNKKIYPVLIVHDTRFEGALHAHFLANEFQHMLKGDTGPLNGDICVGQFLIAPLTVITIETLEVLERSVEHFGLVGMLAEYSRASPDRLMSMHDFLATSHFRKMLYPSSLLAESALEVLSRTKELLAEDSQVNSRSD